MAGMTRLRRCLEVVCLAGLLAAGPLAAGDDGDPEEKVSPARLMEEALAHHEAGRLTEAVATAERAHAAFARRRGAEDAETLTALRNVGLLRKEAGDVEGARRAFDTLLEVRTRLTGEESEATAQALADLARVDRMAGAMEEAHGRYGRVLEICRKVHGAADPRTASALSDLAVAALSLGRPAEARDLLEEAIRIYGGLPDSDPTSVALLRVNLAGALQELGDLRAAESAFRGALETCERTRGPDDPWTLVVKNNLGMLLREQARFEEAIPWLEDALRATAARYGPAHPETTSSQGNLAVVHIDLGQLEVARDLLEDALRAAEAAGRGSDPDLAYPLDSLAGVMHRLGLAQQAIPLYERALALRRATLPAGHPLLATTEENLAGARQILGDLEAAESGFRAALQGFVGAYGERHVRSANSRDNLAGVLERRVVRDLGLRVAADLPPPERLPPEARARLQESDALATEAFRIYEEVLGGDHPSTAVSRSNLALRALRAGPAERRAALGEAQRALADLVATLGEEHALARNARANVCDLQLALGLGEEARRTSADLLAAWDRDVRRAMLAAHGSERIALVGSERWVLDQALRVAQALGGNGYEAVLRVKGLVTRVQAAEARRARRADAGFGERVQALAVLERQYAALSGRVPPRRDAERRAAWAAEMERLRSERDRLGRELARVLAPDRLGIARPDVGLAQVAASLPEDAALLDTLLSEGRYRAWVVRRGRPPEAFDLGEAEEVEAALAEVQADLDQADPPPERREARARLRARLLGPLAPLLGNEVRTLVVSPDAALAAFPFAALPGGGEVPWLVDECALLHVGMAQDLVEDPERAPSGRGALLVGGVDFDAGRASADLGTAAGALRLPQFLPLPGTRAEVEALAARLGEGTTTLTGAEATEERVAALARGRRLLHLATHGFVRNEGPRRVGGADVGVDPSHLAGIALAGANGGRDGTGDDGVLTAAEAAGLDLDGVDLVVLSACSTALGRPASGEGVVGLVQAFGLAGARDVVATLWEVDDPPTLRWMDRFHEVLPTAPGPWATARAARDAMRTLREAEGSAASSSTGGEAGAVPERRRRYAAPRHWAGFVVYVRGAS